MRLSKNFFLRVIPVQEPIGRPVPRVAGGFADVLLRQRSADRPKSGYPADIVHQGEPRPHPLYIHFQFEAQGEAVHVPVDTDAGKDRLDNAQPSGMGLIPCSVSIFAFNSLIGLGCRVSTCLIGSNRFCHYGNWQLAK